MAIKAPKWQADIIEAYRETKRDPDFIFTLGASIVGLCIDAINSKILTGDTEDVKFYDTVETKYSDLFERLGKTITEAVKDEIPLVVIVGVLEFIKFNYLILANEQAIRSRKQDEFSIH